MLGSPICVERTLVKVTLEVCLISSEGDETRLAESICVKPRYSFSMLNNVAVVEGVEYQLLMNAVHVTPHLPRMLTTHSYLERALVEMDIPYQIALERKDQ